MTINPCLLSFLQNERVRFAMLDIVHDSCHANS